MDVDMDREMLKAAAMEIGLSEEEAEDAIDVLGSDVEEYGEWL